MGERTVGSLLGHVHHKKVQCGLIRTFWEHLIGGKLASSVCAGPTWRIWNVKKDNTWITETPKNIIPTDLSQHFTLPLPKLSPSSTTLISPSGFRFEQRGAWLLWLCTAVRVKEKFLADWAPNSRAQSAKTKYKQGWSCPLLVDTTLTTLQYLQNMSRATLMESFENHATSYVDKQLAGSRKPVSTSHSLIQKLLSNDTRWCVWVPVVILDIWHLTRTRMAEDANN